MDRVKSGKFCRGYGCTSLRSAGETGYMVHISGLIAGGRGRGYPPLKAVRDPTEQKRKAKTEKQREETDKTKVMNSG